MAVSEAKMKSNHKYDAKAYRMITLRVPRSIENEVLKKAKERGSLNGYIVDLIKKDLGITEK